MAIAFVQKTVSVGVFNGSLTATLSLTGVTAGNAVFCLVGHYAYDGANPTFTITDGTSYTQDSAAATAGKQAIISSQLNASAGTHNVVVTASSGNPANSEGAIQLVEFSGVATSGAFDRTATVTATNTAPNTGVTPTLRSTGQLVLAALATNASGTGFTSPPTGGPGTYTNLATGALDNAFIGDFDYQLNVGTAAVSANWGTFGTAVPWGALVATYFPAGVVTLTGGSMGLMGVGT